MSRAVLVGFLLPRAVLLSIVTITVLVLPAPAGANPMPDAMVYFNVRPAGSPEEYCVTEITQCDDMNQSTEQQGLIEFQIFIDPQQSFHGAIPVPAFAVDLSWPESWILMDYRCCREAIWFNFGPSGSNSQRLEIQWPCTVPDDLFLAATLVFDVQGYGKLDTSGECALWLDCPAFVVYPTANYAEAGTGCEYTDQPCATHSYRCLPDLAGLQLPMTAPEGGMAHGELEFEIDGYPYPLCDFTANSEAPWATGYVVSDPNLRDAVLFVDADATGLEPGTHESEMQIAYDGFYSGAPARSARCLPVILTVEPATSVEDSLPPHASAAPLDLRLAGANPSSGPFVFTYETITTSHVRCDVYDASGREVARLLDDEQPGGRHTVTWRAADAAGRLVRPGVYMVRLARDEEVRISRVIVVR